MASSPQQRHLKPPGHLWTGSGDPPQLRAADRLDARAAEGTHAEPDYPPLTRGGWWFLFCTAELVLIIPMLLLSFVWQWWRYGERIEGVIVDIEEQDDSGMRWATIRDPDTELEITLGLGEVWAPWDRRGWGYEQQVGDMATAVISRSDPSKVATPGEVQLYVALWAVLPLSIILLPMWSALKLCWRTLRPGRRLNHASHR